DYSALKAVEVRQHQLRLDRLGIRDRIDAAFDMGDVVVLEAAQHMNYRVNLANVGEKLIAQPFPFGSAAHQARNVHEGDAGGDDVLGFRDSRDLLKPRVGHRHLARV